jgi:putative redox protein
MTVNSRLEWIDKMAFEAELNGHKFIIDSGDPKFGGEDRGPRPKPLLLVALAGCTGMDVVSILKKMKVENFKFHLDTSAEETTEHPKFYQTFRLDYVFDGDNLPEAKIKKAVKLSEERYCGVSKMLKESSKIINRIIINGDVVE